MENTLPVYQHPALTVLVDDSRSFLSSLSFQLGPRFGCKTFYEARAALDWLRESRRTPADRERGTIRVGYDEDGDSLDRRSVSLFLDRIYRIVMDRRRFATPAVLVVDYAMPEINGLELCAMVGDMPMKKILLTGQADEKIAIDAFNRKLIDRFIKKSDPGAIDFLRAEIPRLQQAFFDEQTSTVKDLVSRHVYAFLRDPAIGALVEELRNRYRFVEHYLFPNPPGILFFDERGKPTLMVIETAEGLTAHYEIAVDQGAPAELLAALREFRLVPFFSDTGGMYLKDIGENWLSYCLPPRVCRGRNVYYWALFDLPLHYLQGPVYSYAEYLLDQQTDRPA
jgi:CheY-like chemotaxis protein